jgi:hypothetical protein
MKNPETLATFVKKDTGRLWILHCPSGFPLTFIYYLQSVLCPVSFLTNVASVSGVFIASSGFL